MQLLLKNNLTHTEYNLQVEDTGNGGLYFQFVVDFTHIEQGEFSYTLLDDEGKKAGSGIIRVGEYTQVPQTTSYNNEKKYITYNGK